MAKASKTNTGKTNTGKTTTDAGKKASAGLKRAAANEEKKIEARKGSAMPKGAARVVERSKSSDGKSPAAKQK